MSKNKVLSGKQLELIDDMAENDVPESQLLKKHGIKRDTLRRWMSEPAFQNELEFRRQYSVSRQKMLITRYAPVAAVRLISLTDPEKGETARKACLDVMAGAEKIIAEKNIKDGGRHRADKNIDPETASKLLDVLGGKKGSQADDLSS